MYHLVIADQPANPANDDGIIPAAPQQPPIVIVPVQAGEQGPPGPPGPAAPPIPGPQGPQGPPGNRQCPHINSEYNTAIYHSNGVTFSWNMHIMGSVIHTCFGHVAVDIRVGPNTESPVNITVTIP